MDGSDTEHDLPPRKKVNNNDRIVETFQIPNTLSADWKPSVDESYPYGQETRTGYSSLVKKPSTFIGNWYDSTTQKAYIPHKDLLNNVATYQKKMLEADPDKYIFLVAFAGGPFLSQHKTYSDGYKHIQTWLNDVEFEDKGRISIHPVIAERPMPSALGDPNGYILEGASSDFSKWILDQHLISLVAPGATFFAHPINPENRSWVVLTLQAGANCQIVDDEEFKHATLGSVLKTIYENKGVLNWAKKYLQARPHDPQFSNISPAQLLFELTKSYQIVYLENGNTKKEIEPRLQIHGKPVSDKSSELAEFACLVRNLSYHVGFKKIDVDKRVIQCLWCKQSNHTRFKCPYPLTEGWLGFTTEELEKLYEEAMGWGKKVEAKKKDNVEVGNSSRGRSRGNGHAPHSTDGYATRGWTPYVPRGGASNRSRGHRGSPRGRFFGNRGSTSSRGGASSRGGRSPRQEGSNPQYNDYYYVEDGNEYD